MTTPRTSHFLPVETPAKKRLRALAARLAEGEERPEPSFLQGAVTRPQPATEPTPVRPPAKQYGVEPFQFSETIAGRLAARAAPAVTRGLELGAKALGIVNK